MQNKTISMDAAHDFYAKMPLARAIPLGLQHVFAMFVGNLTPLLIIMGACGIAGGEFADLQVSVLQNAMFVAGVVTLVQLFAIGPIGGKVPIIMGTSSGFIGVFNSVAATMGGGVLAYGAIMGASLIGGLFEGRWRRHGSLLLREAVWQVVALGRHRYGGAVHRSVADLGRHQFLRRR